MSQQKNTGWAEVRTDTQEEITQQTQNDRVGENMLGYAALTQPTTDIPMEWIQTTIGSVCELNPKNKLQDNLDVAFMPMAGVPVKFLGKPEYEIRKWHEVKKGYTQFRDGDTLFAKITPCFENEKACVVDKLPNGWGAGSTEYFVLRPINNFVHPKLLLALVKTKGFLLGGAINMTGSVGHKRVPKEFVANYPLQLPPLAEQHQIAAKLDELLAQVDSIKTRLDAIPKILKRFRQSVLAEAVSGKLTEDWRKENSPSNPLNTWSSAKEIDALFDISNEWKGVTLGSISDRVSVGHVGKTTEYYTDEMNGIPFFRSQNVRPGSISLEGLTYITEDFHKSLKKSQLKPGDLLVVRVGANRGDACILPDIFERLNCANIVFARPKKGLSEYLNIYFQSPIVRDLLIGETVGGAQGVINTKSVEKAFLALPSQEEQNEIVRRVEQLFAYADQIEQRVKDAQTRVNHLTQAILAKAFRGELTVDWRAQNSDLISGENSAEALLSNIQAERITTSSKSTRRSKSNDK